MRCVFAANGRRHWKTARKVRGCYGTWMRGWKRIWLADAPGVQRIKQLRYSDGGCTQPLGNHRASRTPCDAADEPVARAALDPLLDDRRHADGRWLAVVRTGRHAAALRRGATVRCGGNGRGGRG